MKEEWLMPGAVAPVDAETTAALVSEIKRLIGVVGSIALSAQPAQQEPVAWWDEKLGVFEEKHFDQLQPLYTRPQPAEWVGLTDEERESIWKADQMTQEEWDELFATIEDMLKRKNT